MLPLYPYGNHSHTNIILRLPNPAGEISQISVFVNGSTGRYDMFLLASDVPTSFATFPGIERCRNHECTYRFMSDDGLRFTPRQLVGSMGEGSDGSFVYRQHGPKGQYFRAYLKIGLPAPAGGFVPWDVGAGHARMIMRSDSPDGDVWSPMTYTASADWRDGQADQFVGLYAQDAGDVFLKSSLDGRPVQLGTMGIFHALSQTVDNQFALSDDAGTSWWRPLRVPYRTIPPIGDYGSGVNFCFRTLVEDVAHPGVVHQYFSGTEGIHGDIHSTLPMERLQRGVDAAAAAGKTDPTFGWSSLRSFPGFDGNNAHYESLSFARSSIQFHGVLMRTTWVKHRFVALVPASGGQNAGVVVMKATNCTELTTKSNRASLHVNAVTAAGGTVRAALLVQKMGKYNSSLLPLTGYSVENSVPFVGDSVYGEITWNQGIRTNSGNSFEDGISRRKNRGIETTDTNVQVYLGIELVRARLYGYELNC